MDVIYYEYDIINKNNINNQIEIKLNHLYPVIIIKKKCIHVILMKNLIHFYYHIQIIIVL